MSSGILWCGEPIENLTREELIAALAQMAHSEKQSQERRREQFEFWEKVRAAKASRSRGWLGRVFS